jgi:hypothetical protein
MEEPKTQYPPFSVLLFFFSTRSQRGSGRSVIQRFVVDRLRSSARSELSRSSSTSE